MNRMLQHFGWAIVVWASALVAPAQAGLLTQQLDLSVTYADSGNSFGLDEGWSDVVGVFIYDTDAVDEFGTLTPEYGLFSLTLVLGSAAFTESMDELYMDPDMPGFPYAIFADTLATTVLAFEYLATFGDLSVGITNFGDSIYLSGYEDGEVTLEGVLTFSLVRSEVNQPAMLSLFLLLGALPWVRRRS